MTRPVYAKIEFCRNPETLWGKIESRRWDWLGVHPDGQFVLGSPRTSKGPTLRAAPTVTKPGGETGEHRVEVDEPDGPAGSELYATQQDAAAGFAATVESLRSESGPRLLRVRWFEKSKIVEVEYVVQRPPTYA
jgi:hypothetical protein